MEDEDGVAFFDVSAFIASFPTPEEAFHFFGSCVNEREKMRDYMKGLRVRGVAPSSLLPLLPLPTAPEPPEAPKPPEPSERPPLEMPAGHAPVLVFDTETTGLKPAIVCQLAYVIVENGSVTIKYDELFKLPSGVRITKQAQEVHGISNKDCATRGVDAAEALEAFARSCARILASGGRVVAHNSKFDVRAIRETRLAHNIVDYDENQTLEDRDVFCTMVNSKPHSQLKDKAGRRKAFRNEELYAHFYGRPPSWARLHNALDDVMVTALNYAGGLVRRWW